MIEVIKIEVTKRMSIVWKTKMRAKPFTIAANPERIGFSSMGVSFISFYPAVPRLSFATSFAHIFATGNEFQKYFSARRNSFDLTQNSVKSVLTWVRAWEMSL